jgi:hypothetical protein
MGEDKLWNLSLFLWLHLLVERNIWGVETAFCGHAVDFVMEKARADADNRCIGGGILFRDKLS